MPSRSEVVITGVGVVCPIGIGKESYWSALSAGRSGIGPLRAFDPSGLPVRIAAEISDFDPKLYVRPRKSLKIMSRDSQLGMAAADLCWQDARVDREAIDPERLGVVFGADPIRTTFADCLPAYFELPTKRNFGVGDWAQGAIGRCFPLIMLQNLPNMIPAHISIALDARGPNNTLYQGDVSGLLALGEAARIIERGAADVILAGGASSRMHPYDWIRFCLNEQLSRCADPAAASRPFDARRDGSVRGEGAAAFLLESRAHAERRGARVQAKVLGFSATGDPRLNGKVSAGPVCRAMLGALRDAGLQPRDLGHINADGLSTIADDRLEAQAIRDVFGNIPVTAPKSYFGNLGAASGVVELVASLLALEQQVVPTTLNYAYQDPACPINVVHGSCVSSARPVVLSLNRTSSGQTGAMILAKPD